MLSLCHLKDPTAFAVVKTATSTHCSQPQVSSHCDFLTDLPLSDTFMCILVTVDRISKACNLVPLPSQPIAFGTAETLFNFVF